MIHSLVLKIKRQETPFYATVYKLIKSLRKVSVPSIYVVHRPLLDLTRMLIRLRWRLQQGLWAVPLFKTRCKSCGSGLQLPNGVPWLECSNLQIEIGNNVTIMKTTLASGHTHDAPTLKVGNNSTIGYNSIISVGERVEIGDNVMIAHNCFIADNDGHPMDPVRRLHHEAVTAEEIIPIKIGNNVWIGANCVILKGAEIGDNTVVSPNSVVTGKAIADKVYMGNPARAVKAL